MPVVYFRFNGQYGEPLLPCCDRSFNLCVLIPEPIFRADTWDRTKFAGYEFRQRAINVGSIFLSIDTQLAIDQSVYGIGDRREQNCPPIVVA